MAFKKETILGFNRDKSIYTHNPLASLIRGTGHSFYRVVRSPRPFREATYGSYVRIAKFFGSDMKGNIGVLEDYYWYQKLKNQYENGLPVSFRFGLANFARLCEKHIDFAFRNLARVGLVTAYAANLGYGAIAAVPAYMSGIAISCTKKEGWKVPFLAVANAGILVNNVMSFASFGHLVKSRSYYSKVKVPDFIPFHLSVDARRLNDMAIDSSGDGRHFAHIHDNDYIVYANKIGPKGLANEGIQRKFFKGKTWGSRLNDVLSLLNPLSLTEAFLTVADTLSENVVSDFKGKVNKDLQKQNFSKDDANNLANGTRNPLRVAFSCAYNMNLSKDKNQEAAAENAPSRA